MSPRNRLYAFMVSFGLPTIGSEGYGSYGDEEEEDERLEEEEEEEEEAVVFYVI
jgi:hypothetical protein